MSESSMQHYRDQVVAVAVRQARRCQATNTTDPAITRGERCGAPASCPVTCSDGDTVAWYCERHVH